MDKIALDAFDIRNAENITLKGTVLIEVALSVTDYLETISDATTDLPEDSLEFLEAVAGANRAALVLPRPPPACLLANRRWCYRIKPRWC